MANSLTEKAGAAGRATFPAATGSRRGGPVIQVQADLRWFRRPDTRITSPKSFIRHFVGQALLALI
jgi:hypothetical protein